MRRTASLCEERNSVTAAGDDDGVLSSHQQTWVKKNIKQISLTQIVTTWPELQPAAMKFGCLSQ